MREELVNWLRAKEKEIGYKDLIVFFTLVREKAAFIFI
jgi:hypothetical protein